MSKHKSMFTAAVVAVAITSAGSAQAEVPLPDGYTRLAYIESTDAQQYIDTQYWHQPGDEVVLDAYIPQQNGICAAFGALTTDGGYFYFIPSDNSNGPYNAGYRNGSGTGVSCTTPFRRNRRDRITCQGATATWRDGSLTVASADWPAGKNRMLIFARNRSDPLEATWFIKMKLYSFKIVSADGTPQRDYVPCKTPDGVVGLWDQAKGGFYGNAKKADGRGFVAGECALPTNYTKLAYIESTDAQQYIDTQYWHQPGDEVVLDAYIPQQNGICAAFGALTTDGGYFYFIPSDNSNGPYNAGYRNGSGTGVSCATPFRRNRRDRITCQGATATWRDGSLTVASAAWPTGKNRMLIFARNRSDPLEATWFIKMKLYSFKITGSDGTLQRDYVPCMNPDGVVGLYDRVTDSFLGNAKTSDGTGFVAGYCALPANYTRLGYIESTETVKDNKPYIDTWYWHQPGDKIEFDVYVPTRDKSTESWCAVFGAALGSNSEYFDFLPYNVTDSTHFEALYCNGAESGQARVATPFQRNRRDRFTCQNATITWRDGQLTLDPVPDSYKGGVSRMLIFARNGATSKDGLNVSCPIRMKLYSFKITGSDGTLQRDYVPCKNPDGVVGLYDLITDYFHGNARTSDRRGFVGGDAWLPNGYSAVEYIESSTDHQYINAEYWHAVDDTVEMDIDVPKRDPETEAFCAAFGAATEDEGYFDIRPYYWDDTYSAGINLWTIYNNGKNNSARCEAAFQRNRREKVVCQGDTASWSDGSLTLGGSALSRGRTRMTIFARNTGFTEGCTPIDYIRMKLYAFKITACDGTVQRDFVPCFDGSAYGLFDRVTGRFHANAGGGSFTGGDTTFTENGASMTVFGGELSTSWVEGHTDVEKVGTGTVSLGGDVVFQNLTLGAGQLSLLNGKRDVLDVGGCLTLRGGAVFGIDVNKEYGCDRVNVKALDLTGASSSNPVIVKIKKSGGIWEGSCPLIVGGQLDASDLEKFKVSGSVSCRLEIIDGDLYAVVGSGMMVIIR